MVEPGFPHSLQYLGGHIGKSCSTGILRTIGGTEFTGFGGGGSQYSLICIKWIHSSPQPHLGAYDSEESGPNVQESGLKSRWFLPQGYLRSAGRGGV